MKIQCDSTNEECKYIWICKSKMMFVNCPNCRRTTRNVPMPLNEQQQDFINAYKRDRRVYAQGVSDFGKEETDRLLKEADLEIKEVSNLPTMLDAESEVADTSAEPKRIEENEEIKE